MGSPESAAAALLGAPALAEADGLLAQAAAGKLVEEAVRSRAPGKLGSSVSVDESPLGTRVTVEDPAAKYVLAGTRAHDEAAVTAQAMYISAPGGQDFAAHVSHPATQPNPFLERALEEAMPAVTRLFDESVTKVADAIAAKVGL